ncbi:putative secreted protein [Wickerhamomyces ciferrii]|uniref:Secreted protein n=1 Tax=Wickerhamomyces ciferrii (strain ATCC 14091 / BCRC 22168 / CBS 111 / JCM 3599 / NBRC 0793 / NRRL Y-1031 F-60-10) TaxID=1206466 RepID=K0KUG9_WICCF|nr:uncharacterized protein BN7_6405 [Wickerhamomyces ciferrii]CCH46806.1 putative secreted protein [Wickerhamomyces ciferrii]
MKFKNITLAQAAAQALTLHTYFTHAAFQPVALRDELIFKTNYIKSEGSNENLKSEQKEEEETNNNTEKIAGTQPAQNNENVSNLNEDTGIQCPIYKKFDSQLKSIISESEFQKIKEALESIDIENVDTNELKSISEISELIEKIQKSHTTPGLQKITSDLIQQKLFKGLQKNDPYFKVLSSLLSSLDSPNTPEPDQDNETNVLQKRNEEEGHSFTFPNEDDDLGEAFAAKVRILCGFNPELENMICKLGGPYCLAYYLIIIVYLSILFWRHRKEYYPDPPADDTASKLDGAILVPKEELYKIGQNYVPSSEATHSKDEDYSYGIGGIDGNKLLSLFGKSFGYHERLRASYQANLKEYTKLVKFQRNKMESESENNEDITDEMVHKELTKGIDCIEFRNFDLLCAAQNKENCGKSFLNYNVAMFTKDGQRMFALDPLSGGDYKDLYISIILGLNDRPSMRQTAINSGDSNAESTMFRQHTVMFLNFGDSKEVEFEDDVDFLNVDNVFNDLTYENSLGDLLGEKYSYCGKDSGVNDGSVSKFSSLSDFVNSMRFSVSFEKPSPPPTC